MSKTKLILSCTLGLVVCLAITDCSCGKTSHLECEVVGKYHVPARTEIVTSTDADGNVSIDTINYPDEWHVLSRTLDSTKDFDVNTTVSNYHTVTNGQYITVKSRKGWSGLTYYNRIQL